MPPPFRQPSVPGDTRGPTLPKVGGHLPAKKQIVRNDPVFDPKTLRGGLHSIFNGSLSTIPVHQNDHRLLTREPARELSLLNAVE